MNEINFRDLRQIVGSGCTKHEKHGLINKHSPRHKTQSGKLFVEI